MLRPAAVLAALVLALSVAACSSDGGSDAGPLTVTDAWARPSSGMDVADAAYLTIVNGGDTEDALLGVRTPAAATAELHLTSEGAAGMMAMQPVDRIAVPAGGTVTLEPGGFHVMLIGLTDELTAGSTIELTLTFEHAGEISVRAEVRAP